MRLVSIAALVAAVGFIAEAPKQSGRVSGHPSRPYTSDHKAFSQWEISFRLPAKIRPNTTYWSERFYAVIVKTGKNPPCDGGEFSKAVEALRRNAQRAFPDRKVFADHQCPDLGAVTHSGHGLKDFPYFVAVYAGTTRSEAERTLGAAKKKYAAARLVRVRAGWEKIVQ